MPKEVRPQIGQSDKGEVGASTHARRIRLSLLVSEIQPFKVDNPQKFSKKYDFFGEFFPEKSGFRLSYRFEFGVDG